MLKFTKCVPVCLYEHLQAFTASHSVFSNTIHTYSVFLWGVDRTCLDSNVHSGVMFQTWKCLGLLSQPFICCLLHRTLPLGTHARSRLGLRPCCTLWHGCGAERIIQKKYNAGLFNPQVSFSRFDCVYYSPKNV